MGATLAEMCNEITEIILNNLSLEDKKRARVVCKRWRDLIDHKMEFTITLNDATAKWVTKTKIDPIRHFIIQDFKCSLNLSTSRSQFTKRIKCLTVYSLKNADSIKLLEYCTNAQIIYFCPGAFNVKYYFPLRFLRFENLSSLMISFREVYQKQSKAFVEFAHAVQFPQLQVLVIDWEFAEAYKAQYFAEEYMGMFDLIGNHWKSLRSLKVKVPTKLTPMDTTTAKYNPRKLQNIIDNLNQVELTELCLKYSPLEGKAPFNLALYLTRAQKKLVTFVTCNAIQPSVGVAIVQSEKYLKKLGIMFNSKSVAFDCGLLGNCNGLTQLEIMTEKEAINIRRLPRNISSFFYSGPLKEESMTWVTQNLQAMVDLSFVYRQGDDDRLYFTLLHLVNLLQSTPVTSISLWCGCDVTDILAFCIVVPGLSLYVEDSPEPGVNPLYNIRVDRSIYGI